MQGFSRDRARCGARGRYQEVVRFKSGPTAVIMPDWRRCERQGVDLSPKTLVPAIIDDQVPCSGGSRQRVRPETEQPTWTNQVPWIAWSSMIAGAGKVES